ncbi:hypothetical protein ACB092_05G050900 [Castanea dentata]
MNSKRKKFTVDDDDEVVVDRISELPEDVLQHILSFLPTKQVFQSTLLSTRWKHVWTTFPILKFDKTSVLWSSETKNDPEVKIMRLNFYKFLNKCLRLRSRQSQRPHIKSFTLKVSVQNHKSKSRVDRWIRFVVKSNVEELILFFGGSRIRYPLPHSVLVAKSLTVLTLHYLKLDSIRSDINLPSLKRLSLLGVYADNQIIQNLIFGLELEASDLHDLCINEDLRNLKKLHISTPIVTEKWLDDNLSGLPLLENLELVFCCMLERIKLSSHHHLKSLGLMRCQNLVEVMIDSSKLCGLSYSGNTAISFSLNASGLLDAEYTMSSSYDFLFNFFVKDVIIPKELRETLPSPLYNVKHLKLSIPPPFTRYNFKELLDGLLWISPLPDMLVIESCRSIIKLAHYVFINANECAKLCFCFSNKLIILEIILVTFYFSLSCYLRLLLM